MFLTSDSRKTEFIDSFIASSRYSSHLRYRCFCRMVFSVVDYEHLPARIVSRHDLYARDTSLALDKQSRRWSQKSPSVAQGKVNTHP